MKEIKFRLIEKNKIIGYEVIGDDGWQWMSLELNPDNGERWSLGVFPASKKIRNQFTGLKDKNGKEIYEGDKVKRRVHLVEGKDYMDYTCTVKWNGWCYGLFIHDKQVWGLDRITAREVEITGNIYEKKSIT